MKKLAMEWVSIAEKIWKDVKHNDPRYRRGTIALPLKQRLAFSVGHVFSDLCYIVWSTYLILYFNKVVGLSPLHAGYIFIIAQISEALLTPFIEISIDRCFPNYYPNYGRKKLFHLMGTLIVFISWPLTFSPCLTCSADSQDSAKLGYYAVCVVSLHIGWAIVRIAHISLTPDIFKKQEEIAELNAFRSGLSFGCGVFVFCTIWILLGQAEGRRVTRGLEDYFTTLSLVIVGFGFVFSVIFHCGTSEPPHERPLPPRTDFKVIRRKASSRDLYVLRRYTETSMEFIHQPAEMALSTQTINTDGRSWRQWLNDREFYKLAVVYTCSRVVINVVQFYFILYVTDTLHFSKESIAYFPLVLLITELFANTLIKNARKILGHKWTFCLASLVVLQSCIWFQLQSQTAGKNFVFLSAIMMCSGSSVMLTTSLCLLTELANKDRGSSEFIYSALGFLEKLFVGIIIIIIQSSYPNPTNGGTCPGCPDYVRLFFTLTPAIVTILALIMVFFGFKTSVVITCTDTANRGDSETQTDTSKYPTLPCTESIWTVNDDNPDGSINHYDVPNQLPTDLKETNKRSLSAPVLNGVVLREAKHIPVLIAARMPRVESMSPVLSETDEVNPVEKENPEVVRVEPQFSVSSSARSTTEPEDATLSHPLRMESLPLLPVKQQSSCSTHPSTTSLSKAVECAPLNAENIVIFSYDSFVAGGISAHSSVGAHLSNISGLPVNSERKFKHDKKPDYNRMPLLPSTDL